MKLKRIDLRLWAGRPGRLFSTYGRDTPAAAWTFRHDRILDLQEVTDFEEARQVARSPWLS